MSCEEIFKELAQVAHLLSRKKKKLWPRRQKLQLFFFISLKMQLQISVLFSLSSSHFFQLTTVSTNDILQRESLESDSKKKYLFSGRPVSILLN